MLPLGEAIELLEFATGATVPAGGFGHLDRYGHVDESIPVDTLVTARMTYAFSVATLLGLESFRPYAEHGIHYLAGPLHDTEYGGYYVEIGSQHSAQRKRAYQGSFVVLAGATAARAGIDGGNQLLTNALNVFEQKFWSERDQAVVDSWDRQFTVRESYWGANANMHAVESLLAAYGATRDTVWRDRAAAIAANFIDRRARSTGWMLGEHFDGDWRPLPDYNRACPEDEFRPYGVTIGHLFEWSRLLIELGQTYERPAAWLIESAVALYSTGRRLGWAVDGDEGFIYTVDWDGAPIVRHRPHWVVAEAISAAATLHTHTKDPSYAADVSTWVDYAHHHLRDERYGSWHHGLDENNRPSTRMWQGKPDIYHALQATLIPSLPNAESLATRIMMATPEAFGRKARSQWSTR